MKKILFLLLIPICGFSQTPTDIRATIDSNIYSNSARKITGDILNYTLKRVVALGDISATPPLSYNQSTHVMSIATTTLSGVVSGSGGSSITTAFGSFTSTTLATALTDETGTGAAVFASAPTLTNPIVGTQSPGDNSTKAASTAYVNAAITASLASVDNAVIPVYPPNQGTAFVLTSRYNFVNTAGTATMAVKLPAATVGAEITLGSNVANSVTVYPASGEKFQPIATNGAYLIYNNEVVTFMCQKVGEWTWVSNAPENGHYFVYDVILTQTSTNAPVATVIRNNCPGTMAWSYVSTGNYDITNTGFLVNSKTTVNVGGGLAASGTVIILRTSAPNSFRLITHDIGGSGANGIMTDYTFRINVLRY